MLQATPSTRSEGVTDGGVLKGHPTDRLPVVPSNAVNNRAEVREFLTSRRAKITPQQAGLPESGQPPGARTAPRRGRRARRCQHRVLLPSSERGSLGGVSASVLDALAQALQLDDAERAHLFHLAHARRRHECRHASAPTPEHPLDTSSGAAMGARRYRARRPSSATDGMDLLATNHLGRAMHADLYDREPGVLRRTSPASPSSTTTLAVFYPDWDTAADTCVAILRTEAGRDPHDKATARSGRRAVHRAVSNSGSCWSSHNVPAARRRHQALPPPRWSGTWNWPTRAST